MKSLILTITILGLFVSTSLAGDYTVTILPLQEQGLKYVVDKYNVAQPVQTPQKDAEGNDIPIVPIVPVTKKQYLQSIINDVLNDYVKQSIADEISLIGKKYQKATDAQKTQIKILLGVQ